MAGPRLPIVSKSSFSIGVPSTLLPRAGTIQVVHEMPSSLAATRAIFNPFASGRTQVAGGILSGQSAMGLVHEEANPLSGLKSSMSNARSASLGGNALLAPSFYRDALGALEANELHASIENGELLYAEALIGASSNIAPQEILPLLKRLYSVEASIKDLPASEIGRHKLLQIKLVQAHLLTRYATLIPQRQPSVLKRAEQKLDEALAGIWGSDEPLVRELRLPAELTKVEITARSLEMEHLRGNRKERGVLVNRLSSETLSLARDRELIEEGHADATAEHIADVAMLFARMQLWGRSLEIARALTSSETFKDSAAAKRILNSKTFEHFVDREKTRIFSSKELKAASVSGEPWSKKIKAALYAAHSESLGQSALAGGIGMTAGLVGEYFLTGGTSALGGAAGGALFSTVNRIRNGLRTEEAIDAYASGIFERPAKGTAYDAAALLARGAGDALAWAIPSSLIANYADVSSIIGQTSSTAAKKYLEFFGWVGDGISSLIDPSTYSNAGNSLSGYFDDPTALDMLKLGLGTWGAIAGVYYFGNLMVPSLQEKTKKYAPWMLPGAIALSANMGIEIAGLGDNDYWGAFQDRSIRASIVFGEVWLAMLTAGLVSMAAKKNFKEGLKSLGAGIKTANYVMPLGAAIITGISSPLGGMLKSHMDLSGPMEYMVQGAATTFFILPITLGFSGILKGTIPIIEGISEGFRDSRGQSPLQRLRHTLATAGSEFNMPYTHNRTGRIFQSDVFASGLRTMIGWDTNWGQTSMSVTNNIYGNHASTMMWTEPSGTMWERDAVVKRLSDARVKLDAAMDRLDKGEMTVDDARDAVSKALGLPHDMFTKSGQNIHFLHMLLPNDIFNRIYPVFGFIRAAKPPKFPMLPNKFTYANLYQMLEGDSMNYNLTPEHLETLLQYVETYASEPSENSVLRPVVQALALSRDSKQHGETIKRFFADNPWILDAFDIDLDRLQIEKSRYSRKNRKAVRNAIKMPLNQYEMDMRYHDNAGGWKLHLGLLNWMRGLVRMQPVTLDPASDFARSGHYLTQGLFGDE